MIRRALLSVSDKTGIAEVAQKLHNKGIEILSTGGTARTLTDAGVPVRRVEEVTAFPECFGGRLKTLHPRILGGILFRRGSTDDMREAEEQGIQPIDLVIVNLYPFAEEQSIEPIDIGGPTLLRSAAKNFENVTVVCDPGDYDRVLREIEENGDASLGLRKELAAKVFLHTAAYDALITEWMSEGRNHGILLTGGKKLRYGENPHQGGKFYGAISGQRSADSSAFHVHQGRELSYSNILDADAAWSMAYEFAEPTAVFVKHANPSGIASHENLAEAFQRAYDADRTSAFGVVIALNRPCSKAIIRKMVDQKMFVEVIVAPAYEEKALMLLREKPKVRVMEVRDCSAGSRARATDNTTYRSAFSGMLLQDEDRRVITEKDLTVVTKRKPTKAELRDLLFAWKVVKHAKSNAIVFAKDCVTVGIGSGQTSRVDATWIAAKRAGEKARGAVMASDAFFPFPDSVEEAAKHGIAAIIQPGGSIRDSEVVGKADALGIAMVTTGVRAFRH